MLITPPTIVVVAGPNGAGKSTTAPRLLRDTMGVTEFVNADVIAQGLSAFAPEATAIAAGRIMLQRLRALAAARRTFAFETTLASRSFAPWLAEQKALSYRFYLLFLYLPSPELAKERVAERARRGGHNVPREVIERRYHAGLRNFFVRYEPLADSWRFYNAAEMGIPKLIAGRPLGGAMRINEPDVWLKIKEVYGG